MKTALARSLNASHPPVFMTVVGVFLIPPLRVALPLAGFLTARRPGTVRFPIPSRPHGVVH